MSFKATANKSVSLAGQSFAQNTSYTDTAQQVIQEDIATAQTDSEIAFTLDVSEARVVWIHSTQDVTFETNSGAAPDDSISLTANAPYHWTDDGYLVNLLTTDITAIFITNASGATATVTMGALYDSTP